MLYMKTSTSFYPDFLEKNNCS